MIDVKLIREKPDFVQENILAKNEKADVKVILDFDEKRRSIIQEVEKLKNQKNVVSGEIAILKKNQQDATAKIEAMKQVADNIKNLDEELATIEQSLDAYLLKIPNIAHNSVPRGKTADDNVVVRQWGEPKLQPVKKNHLEIASALGILDFERGAKVAGSGFGYYVGKGAGLERGLINYMLEKHINNGYTELFPPIIVNYDSMVRTGQIPKLEEDMYYAEKDNMYLIPTAEVPLTNFYAKEMMKYEDLPVKFCGYSPCFRREAGSYGKDTRGFLRVHQFNKVELVKFTKPEDSYNELELLVVDVEAILQALNIPYRVLLLCTGDTSFGSAKTYDLEVWSPAEEKYLEVSSCSNFEDFQARRAQIRFKRSSNAKPEFVHTLNGSGLATSRLIVALLETYMQADGSVIVPEVLREYCKFDKI